LGIRRIHVVPQASHERDLESLHVHAGVGVERHLGNAISRTCPGPISRLGKAFNPSQPFASPLLRNPSLTTSLLPALLVLQSPPGSCPECYGLQLHSAHHPMPYQTIQCGNPRRLFLFTVSTCFGSCFDAKCLLSFSQALQYVTF